MNYLFCFVYKNPISGDLHHADTVLVYPRLSLAALDDARASLAKHFDLPAASCIAFTSIVPLA